MRFIITLLLSVFAVYSNAQVLKPAQWTYAISKDEVKEGEEVDLIFKADIDQNWYLYSSDFDPDLGPMVTEFDFEPDPSYELVGDIKPIDPKKKYDEIFEGEYTYFKGKGEFRQTVKVLSDDFKVTGSYSYQVCSDIDGKCIPFEEDFTFTDLQVLNAVEQENEIEDAEEDELPVDILIDENEEDTGAISSPFNISSPSDQRGVIKPIDWHYDVSAKKVNTGEELEILFYADIDENWYLYSSDFDPDVGPMVTEFNFKPHASYELIGEIRPIGAKSKYDSIFEGEYTYFKKKAEFRQTVRVLGPGLTVQGSFEYQVCSDIDGKCIPFEEEFVFSEFEVTGKPVQAKKVNLDLTKRDSNDPYSLLAFMALSFMAGLAAILTPCVFPMIPVTVTFFTKSSESKNGKLKAFLYGLSIVLIYTIAGVGVSFLFGAEVANDLATSATANLIFFAVFVIFGLSFLGLFDINLPSSWVNNVDKQADRGGYLGIIFMALTLCLVSFSCTGPIVGSILVESAGGAFLKPTLGMFAFSMAFAIPFTVFAIFPGWLNSLPKSGGWLNSVKVVLGFLELALSLKFLSIADQVYHWGILDREIFLAIWIVIMVMLGLYFLGKIRLPGDDKLGKLSVPRLLLAIATFSFVTYLIPGMFGAPLKALAGYLPPMTTHDFDIPAMVRQNSRGPMANDETLCDPPKYAEFLEFPHGIKGYFDYDQAIACAREKNKPLFIDFTGHGCVNCREMEARVWSEPEVLKRLKNDFVMVALYVDDKKELPESEWYESSYDGKIKKTIGKQNADFQITRFNNNAQPFYVILDKDEELLVEPIAYTLNIQEFVAFLDKAKERFENRQPVASN